MTNDISELKHLIRKLVDKNPNYLYGYDTSYDAFMKDINDIEELIYCDRYVEARCSLKKLMYNFNKVKQDDLEFGYSGKYYLDPMEERLKELEKQLQKQED
jgi:hypothetical protein